MGTYSHCESVMGRVCRTPTFSPKVQNSNLSRDGGGGIADLISWGCSPTPSPNLVGCPMIIDKDFQVKPEHTCEAMTMPHAFATANSLVWGCPNYIMWEGGKGLVSQLVSAQ